jgi:hypothetical protein
MSSLTLKMKAFHPFERRPVLPNVTEYDPEDLNVGQPPYDNLKYQKGVTCDKSVSGIRIGHILHCSSHTITQVVSVSVISVVGKATCNK